MKEGMQPVRTDSHAPCAMRCDRNVQRLIAVVMVCSAAAWTGCGDREAQRRARQFQREQNTEQISLNEIVETLNHLYERVNLEIEPPQVILDRRKTLDGEKAYATFGPNPAAESPQLSNYITITSRNVRLKALDVKPDDQVQYFVVQDPLNPDPFAAGIGEAALDAVPMTVAQVVDDEHIIVKGGYPQAVDQEYEIQILRYVDDRAQDIRERLDAYAGYAQPLLDWEPSPDSLEIENTLNLLSQWMRHTFATAVDTPFSPPALLETLPESIRKSSRLADYISPSALGYVSFSKHEGRQLQQAVWLRNISNWARGDAVGEVELAERLFDWTVRHIQLEESSPELAHHLARDPWEIVLYGTGTTEQRAWVFAQLCRQQGVSVVLLSVPQGNAQDEATPIFWCAAVMSQGQLYLFDPKLGLPIPGAGGQGVATLAEASKDPDVLGQLDLDDANRYPVSHDQAGRAEAMIAGSPFSLSRRAALLQEKLVGQSGFVIADDVTPLAESLKDHQEIQSVVLWPWPFETLDRKLAMGLAPNQRQRVRAALEFRVFAFEPHLWKARALHFRGPAPRSEEESAASDAAAIDGHQEAIGLYQAALASAREFARERSDEKRQTMQGAKESALYWLALLKMDQGLTKGEPGDLEIAASSWFPEVIGAKPPSAWLAGARYNLARTHEALGRIDEAVELLERDDSPQSMGNRLRARRLREARPLAQEPPDP